MKSDATKSRSALIMASLCVLGVQVIGLGCIISLAWFVYSVINESIDSRLIAFDSEPPEGWACWRGKFQREALVGWSIPLFVAAGLGGLLFWGIGSRLRSITAVFKTRSAENRR